VTVKEDGERREREEQLSGVCGINKSTIELQGGNLIGYSRITGLGGKYEP
jgi:hypothetical protein